MCLTMVHKHEFKGIKLHQRCLRACEAESFPSGKEQHKPEGPVRRKSHFQWWAMFLSWLLGMTVTQGRHGVPFTCSYISSDTPCTQHTNTNPRRGHAEYLKEPRHPPLSSLGNTPLSLQLLCVTDTAGTQLPLDKQNPHTKPGADAQRQQFL